MCYIASVAIRLQYAKQEWQTVTIVVVYIIRTYQPNMVYGCHTTGVLISGGNGIHLSGDRLGISCITLVVGWTAG